MSVSLKSLGVRVVGIVVEHVSDNGLHNFHADASHFEGNGEAGAEVSSLVGFIHNWHDSANLVLILIDFGEECCHGLWLWLWLASLLLLWSSNAHHHLGRVVHVDVVLDLLWHFRLWAAVVNKVFFAGEEDTGLRTRDEFAGELGVCELKKGNWSDSLEHFQKINNYKFLFFSLS